MSMEKNNKTKFNWDNLAFWFIIFAIILPILMIAFDFGPTEKAENYEDMKQNEYEDLLWDR